MTTVSFGMYAIMSVSLNIISRQDTDIVTQHNFSFEERYPTHVFNCDSTDSSIGGLISSAVWG